MSTVTGCPRIVSGGILWLPFWQKHMTSGPKFKNCYTEDQFIGHYFGHDVYLSGGNSCFHMGSVLARYGDDDCEYASVPLACYIDQLENPGHRIGGLPGGESMPYQDYIFSGQCGDYSKAMILALAVYAIKVSPVVEQR